MKDVGVLIVGAGVIGVATARRLAQSGALGSVTVLEKEDAPAAHTSGRNSGVIHSGFNAKPGSLKAKFCVEGNRRLRRFCEERSLPMQPVGTVVTALDEADERVLEELLRRGRENGVEGLRLVDRAGLLALEPHALGRAALHSPAGAIASGRRVVKALAEEARQAGVDFRFGARVSRLEADDRGVTVVCANGDRFRARVLINCAGLYADVIAHELGVAQDLRIVAFRGEYFRFKGGDVLRSMLYPVPNLNYPFLGVHWTRTVDGDILIGPNATLAWSRESYAPLSFRPSETLDMVTDARFWRMFAHADFFKTMLGQLQISLSRERFVAEARKLIGGVRASDFDKGKAGNRAQLIDRQGRLVDDMMVVRAGRAVHVLNAVSPGFTCSLPFADHLAGLAQEAAG